MTKVKSENRLKKALEVFSYAHRVSHILKKVAGRHNICTVGSAPSKLKAMSKKVNSLKETTQNVLWSCGVKHVSEFDECAVGVVYKITFSCGASYIGQIDRLRAQQRLQTTAITGPSSCPLCYGCAGGACNCAVMLSGPESEGGGRGS